MISTGEMSIGIVIWTTGRRSNFRLSQSTRSALGQSAEDQIVGVGIHAIVRNEFSCCMPISASSTVLTPLKLRLQNQRSSVRIEQ
jgi:hypothetical protein